jgi:FixJ family two-component response regulator
VQTPSCLVLDVNLPNLSGLELQTFVSDRTDMPIIFMSGYGDVPLAVHAMRAGAVEFFTSPWRTTCYCTRSRTPSTEVVRS